MNGAQLEHGRAPLLLAVCLPLGLFAAAMTANGCTKCATCDIAGSDASLISGVYVGSKNVGSGVSKYDGMRCINRILRISGKPIITSMQLSITLASIFRSILSDFVTSLNKVKSNTTVGGLQKYINAYLPKPK